MSERHGRAVYRRRNRDDDRNVRARGNTDSAAGAEIGRDEIENPSEIPESSAAAAQRPRRSVSQHVQQLSRSTMSIDWDAAEGTDDDDDDEVDDENYRINPNDAGDEEDEVALGSLVGQLRHIARPQQIVRHERRQRA